MASRLDFSQIRSLYVGTSSNVTVGTDNLVVAGSTAIGTTSAFTFGGTAKLSVYADAPITFALSNTDAVYFRRYGVGQYQFQTTNSGGNTGDLSLQSYGGNVGIGTTAPTSKLFVLGTGTYNTATSEILASDATIFSSEMSNDAYNSILQLVSVRQSLTTGNASNGFLGFSTIDDSNAQGIRDAGRIAIVNEVGSSRNSATSLSFWTNAGGTNTTSATEKVRITSAGNVGIGTTSPSYKLDVSGGIRSATIDLATQGVNVSSYGFLSQTLSGQMTFLGHNVRASNTVNNTALVVNGGWISSLIKQYFSEGITFHTSTTEYAAGATYPLADTERMRITSAGNVGIGTTTPGYKLEVSGDSYFSGLAHFGQTATSGSAFRWGSYGTAVSADTMLCMNQLWNGSGWSILESSYGTTAINLGSALASPTIQFQTGGANTVASTRMIILNNGNVGIGTTAPTAKFGVKLATATSVSTIANSTGWDNTYAVFGNPETGTSQGYAIGVTNTLNGINILSINPASDWVDTNHYSRNHIFYGGETERMRITIGGNVGIGATSPQTRLQVVSNIDHVSGDISINKSILDLYNNYESDVAEKGAILTFSDNYYDNVGPQKTIRAAIKGGTQLAGNTADGFLAFYTDSSSANSATERVRINASGNVGIGTTSPSDELTVNSAGNSTGIAIQRSGVTKGLLEIGSSSDTFAISATSSTGILTFATNSSEQMRITSAGNVGIGTTSVDAKLFVQSSVSSTEPTMFVQSGTGAGQYGMISTGDSFHGIVMRGKPAAATTYGVTAGDEMSFFEYGGIFNFYKKDAIGPTLNLFARISSNSATYFNGGNVGIGTTSPSARLDIDGQIQIGGASATPNVAYGMFAYSGVGLGIYSGAGASNQGIGIWLNNGSPYEAIRILSGGNVGIGTTSPARKLQVEVGSTAEGGQNWSHSNGTVFARLGIVNPGVNNNTEFGSASNNDLVLLTVNAEKMRITAGGNVGIGTTAPSYKLQTEGDIVSAGEGNTRLIGFDFYDSLRYNFYVDGNSDADKMIVRKGTTNVAAFDTNGNVGIGTTSPSEKLHVVGTGYFTSFVGIAATTTSSWGLAVGTPVGADGAIKTTGSVQINSGALAVGSITPSATAGRIDASNDIVAYSTSDSRLKENITPIANALDKVNSLTGVEFDWKEETKDVHGYEGHDVGVIAQEVQAVLPEAIRTNDSGYLSVRYEKMIALLIEANKELANRVELLEQKLKQQ